MGVSRLLQSLFSVLGTAGALALGGVAGASPIGPPPEAVRNDPRALQFWNLLIADPPEYSGAEEFLTTRGSNQREWKLAPEDLRSLKKVLSTPEARALIEAGGKFRKDYFSNLLEQARKNPRLNFHAIDRVVSEFRSKDLGDRTISEEEAVRRAKAHFPSFDHPESDPKTRPFFREILRKKRGESEALAIQLVDAKAYATWRERASKTLTAAIESNFKELLRLRFGDLKDIPLENVHLRALPIGAATSLGPEVGDVPLTAAVFSDMEVRYLHRDFAPPDVTGKTVPQLYLRAKDGRTYALLGKNGTILSSASLFNSEQWLPSNGQTAGRLGSRYDKHAAWVQIREAADEISRQHYFQSFIHGNWPPNEPPFAFAKNTARLEKRLKDYRARLLKDRKREFEVLDSILEFDARDLKAGGLAKDLQYWSKRDEIARQNGKPVLSILEAVPLKLSGSPLSTDSPPFVVTEAMINSPPPDEKLKKPLFDIFERGGQTDAEFYNLVYSESLAKSERTRLPGRSDGLVGLAVETRVPQRPDGRYVQIPSPDGHELVAISVKNGQLREGVDYWIVKAPGRDAYAVELLRAGTEDVSFTADFAKRTPSPVTAFDTRLTDRVRLRELGAELKRARFSAFSDAIDDLLERSEKAGKAIELEELADLFSTESRYTRVPERNPFAGEDFGANRFRRFTRFLERDGRMYGQCDSVNALFAEFLDGYYHGKPGVRVTLGPGFFTRGKTLSFANTHMRVEVRKAGAVVRIYDVTPKSFGTGAPVRLAGDSEPPSRQQAVEVEAEGGGAHPESAGQTEEKKPVSDEVPRSQELAEDAIADPVDERGLAVESESSVGERTSATQKKSLEFSENEVKRLKRYRAQLSKLRANAVRIFAPKRRKGLPPPVDDPMTEAFRLETELQEWLDGKPATSKGLLTAQAQGDPIGYFESRAKELRERIATIRESIRKGPFRGASASLSHHVNRYGDDVAVRELNLLLDEIESVKKHVSFVALFSDLQTVSPKSASELCQPKKFGDYLRKIFARP